MRSHVLMLLGLTALLGACSETRPLLDERGTQPYAAWAHVRGQGYGRATDAVDAAAPGAPALRVRLIHLAAAQASDDRLLVLQPGILADHRTWRFLAPLLAERNDVLLVDPPGTGASAAPDPRRNPAPVYTPEWIGRHTLRAVARWQETRRDVRRLVFVGHSLGSAALARAFTEPRSPDDLVAVRARTDGLVLFTLPDVLMDTAPASFEKVAGLSDLEVRAGAALGILDREMADAIHQGVVSPRQRALRQEADRLKAMIAAPRTRLPAQAMLRRFRPLDGANQPRMEAARVIADRERSLQLPVLLIWGREDDTLPFAMAAAVAARLPHVERLDVPDAKHSPHQERPDLCAYAIAQFLSAHPGPRER